VLLATFPVGLLECNCSVLVDPGTREAVIVDPGGDADRLLDLVRVEGLTLKALVHTHAHLDHVMASARLRQETGAPTLLHPDDRFLWDNVPMQGAMFGMRVDPAGELDGDLADGRGVSFGSLSLDVLHTPGHTPGSVCFHLGGERPVLLAGDTLFQGSIGRTDLWGGDFQAILRSIHTRLLTLPGETRVVTGHGPETTIARERRYNPFLS